MRFFERTPRFPLSSVDHYRLLAKKKLPQTLFSFIEGGAFQETTLQSNRVDFNKIQLRKRVLKDVSQVETGIELLGQHLKQPLILAPVGFAGLYAKRGEVQAARAAESSGIPFCLSSVSICSLEEVCQTTSAPFWYQMYLFKERNHSLELLQRAKAVHCPILLLSVDLPSIGIRSQRHRNYSLPTLKQWPWWWQVRMRGGPLSLGNMPSDAPTLSDLSQMRQWMSRQLHPGLTWKDLEWVRAHWPGKIVLKGILDAEDARSAVESGVDGIVISNHGGRHLDGIPSTISALPSIAKAIQGRIPILIDGGIASGLDVIKALALGAQACLIGRSWAYGLAARGEQGVREIIALLQHELQVAMAHLGIARIQEIDRSIIA